MIKRNRLDPIGSASALPFGGKTFSSFQKGMFTLVFLKTREPFPTPKKWKEYSIGPLGFCDRLPPGDKTFNNTNEGKSVNWTKAFSNFSKKIDSLQFYERNPL